MLVSSPGRLGCRGVSVALSLVAIVVLLAISVRDPVLGGRLVDENNVVEWLQVVLCGGAAVLAFRQGRAARRAGQPATLEVAIVAAMPSSASARWTSTGCSSARRSSRRASS